MSKLSWRECYQVLGPKFFWRSILWGFTCHTFPRAYDPAAEVFERCMELRAQEVLGADR